MCCLLLPCLDLFMYFMDVPNSPCHMCRQSTSPQCQCSCASSLSSNINTILNNVTRLGSKNAKKSRKGASNRSEPVNSNNESSSGSDNGSGSGSASDTESTSNNKEENIDPKLVELVNQILQKSLQEKGTYFQEEHTRVYNRIKLIQDTDVSLHDRIIGKKDMPIYVKAVAIMKLKHAGPENSLERANTIKWLENLLKIPFGKYIEFKYDDVSSRDLMQFCKEKFEWFDKEIYGMQHVKEELIGYLVDFITSPTNRKPILGLCGSPGVGKTKILKMMSTVLGLPSETLRFGGKKNPEQFEGQDPVFVSSMYGDIVAVLMKTQCMNPIIILEEIDKVASDDIYGVLTHLLDPEQNGDYKDKYFPEVKIDLSRVVFAITYNDRSVINPIVLDRIKEIVVPPKTVEEKIHIVEEYLLPNILKKYNLPEGAIRFDSSDTVRYIINSKTPVQHGLRKLFDNVYDIVRKINTLLELYKDCKIQENILGLSYYIKEIVKVAQKKNTPQHEHLSVVVDKTIVDTLLDSSIVKEEPFFSMYI